MNILFCKQSAVRGTDAVKTNGDDLMSLFGDLNVQVRLYNASFIYNLCSFVISRNTIFMRRPLKRHIPKFEWFSEYATNREDIIYIKMLKRFKNRLEI